MAAHMIEEPTTEFCDESAVIQSKLEQLVGLMKESNNTIIFTGAGLSTSAAIPDFRGDKGLDRNPVPLVMIGQAEQDLQWKIPTVAHRAIACLVESGHVDFVATSNHDGLHQKAGLPHDKIADVFGNAYVEKCYKCKTVYPRDVITPNLGRSCDNPDCDGRLRKLGTRMGAATPQKPLQRAVDHAQVADLAIVLGSSMTVSPFCELPGLARRFVLVTLQETAYDGDAALCIHAKCDQVMGYVVQQLGVSLGVHSLRHRFVARYDTNAAAGAGQVSVSLVGSRPNEPATCVAEATVTVVPPAAAGGPAAPPPAVATELQRGRDLVFTAGRVAASAGDTLQLEVCFQQAIGADPVVAHLLLDGSVGEVEGGCSVDVDFDAMLV